MSFPEPGNYQQGFGHDQRPPPSGYRIPSATNEPFPDPLQAGEPPFHDLDGSPIFIGSAIMENSVHPCKIGPNLHNYVSVPYGGGEHAHEGRYDLLPFRPHEMEWVPTSYGQIPKSRRPVEGGYEEGGEKLYHAAAVVYDVRVPGKAGEHL
ncbi:hypothetical protein BJ165DRAFT_1461542 [Panaeolus papilionaceus]|nr:hypothetical protein BJ165DRAFT_1461542 [Panaeolus papilionaceus]